MESVRDYSQYFLERVELMRTLAVLERDTAISGPERDQDKIKALDETIEQYDLEHHAYSLIIKRINDLLKYIRNIFITM